MKINWKVRLRQKHFLVGMFSAILLFVQTVAELCGFHISDTIGDKVTYIFNSVLGILTILGVVVDPTTKSLSDSEQAQKYSEPK
ncbi:phage holin [Neobacillus sp. YIM B02564]|uniref:Phage holin n=1 Tax=Neobacillus paridis TaxID=2803862 RepID=A0ABS1TVH0_9BACI|nr:phage holin [Neobacillus paridis]MBL4955203.1 phage holin [Neobacillus paridis]